MSVDDVVRRAQTSHGSFYLYFPDKEDLFKALPRDALHEMKIITDEFPVVTRNEAGQATLRGWVQRFCDIYLAHAAVIRVLSQPERLSMILYAAFPSAELAGGPTEWRRGRGRRPACESIRQGVRRSEYRAPSRGPGAGTHRTTIYICYSSAVSAANATSKTAPTADAGIGVGEALTGLAASAVRRLRRDMSLTSLVTLATLDRAGPQRITDLARMEGVAQPSMTVLVGMLERDGFVLRRRDPSDKRVVLIELTAAGMDLVQSRRRASAQAWAQLIEKLPSDEAAALVAALPALEHLRELEDGHRARTTRLHDQQPGR
jgi:DNA-binding MarR family transcriptional regulator